MRISEIVLALHPRQLTQHQIQLRVCTKIIVGPIILFGLYVQFHGDYGPGGGFQAGVIVAAGFILHSLIFGLKEGRKLVSENLNLNIMILGVLLYGGVGLISLYSVSYTHLTLPTIYSV